MPHRRPSVPSYAKPSSVAPGPSECNRATIPSPLPWDTGSYRGPAMANRMPVLFIGHGSPMNAVQRNRYTEAWSGVGVEVPRPSAVLCVSAPWYIPGAALTVTGGLREMHELG